MKVSQQVLLRERVYAMLGHCSKIEIVRHFLKENISKSTIYSIIKRFECGAGTMQKPKSGRPSKLTKKQCQVLRKSSIHRLGVSQRRLAKKFNVSKTCIQRKLVQMNINRYKRQKAPKYTEKQLAVIPKLCRKLNLLYRTHQDAIVMDDEKYFTFSNSTLSGNAGFYTDNINNAPAEVRFASKQKFEPKVLVWVAISEQGVSQAFMSSTKGFALNSKLYQEKCLSKLKKFIRIHHGDGKYRFWPDLASCHYSADTQEWLRRENIRYVPKDFNPPNVPKARPIEDFWGILSQKVYEKGWEAKSAASLKRRITLKLKEIDLDVVRDMMSKVRQKLRKISEKGPLSIL